MRTMYFNHQAVVREAALLAGDTPADGRSLTLSVPDKLQETFRREAFYCRASQDEMPSRAVIYGTAIMSLMSKGIHVDFQYDPTPETGLRAGRPAVRHLPFNFPRPEETDRIIKITETVRGSSDGEMTVRINPSPAALLEKRCQENGLSREENFIALSSLVEYVGTAEREGLHLSVYADDRAGLEPEALMAYS